MGTVSSACRELDAGSLEVALIICMMLSKKNKDFNYFSSSTSDAGNSLCLVRDPVRVVPVRVDKVDKPREKCLILPLRKERVVQKAAVGEPGAVRVRLASLKHVYQIMSTLREY